MSPKTLTAPAPVVAPAAPATPAAPVGQGRSFSRAAGAAGSRVLPIVLALIGILVLWYAVSYLLLSESRRRTRCSARRSVIPRSSGRCWWLSVKPRAWR